MFKQNFASLHAEIRAFADKVERALVLGDAEIAQRNEQIANLQKEQAEITEALRFLQGVKKGFSSGA